MNFLFLSPHFPPNYRHFCRALRDAGLNVLGVGDADFGALHPELAASLAWYYRVENMHDRDELRRACRFFADRFGPIYRLDSLNEYWLETEAALRTEFGIEGVHTDTIADIRHKSRMKRIFSAAGVPHARGRLIHNLEELKAFAGETGFPVIVKPDDGMGAALTYRLRDAAQLEAFFASKPDREFIAEEYIAGDIVTFDGLADREGRVVFCTSHVYGESVMDAVLADSHISYYSVREIPPDLEDAGRRLVEGFKVHERFFHFEFFRRPDGSLCALEANIRPPGGFTMDMFNYACDIDLYAAWAGMMAGKDPRLEYTRKYHCCYAGRKHRLAYRYSREEVERRLGPAVVMREELPPVLARAMGDCGYVVRSPDRGFILDAVRLIQELR